MDAAFQAGGTSKMRRSNERARQAAHQCAPDRFARQLSALAPCRSSIRRVGSGGRWSRHSHGHFATYLRAFFTTKTKGSTHGTGLGLSTVYTIAQQDGLGLGVDTQAGIGSIFRVLIPAGA
jgi:hypothetical protein